MTLNTASINVDGTASWNKSDMELTNTSRGFRQVSGSPSVFS